MTLRPGGIQIYDEGKVIKEEIEAMKSIFFNSIDSLSPEPGYYRAFQVKVFPNTDKYNEQSPFEITLTFHLPKQYPEQIPKVEISKSEGISYQSEHSILQALFDESLKLSGEKMLFELIMHAQDLINEYHRISVSPEEYVQLHDSMLEKTKSLEKQREAEKLKKKEEDKKREKEEREQILDLYLNMDGSKESYLRREWLNERETMHVEEEIKRPREEDHKKESFENINEKDLLLVHLLRIIANLISKSTKQPIAHINKTLIGMLPGTLQGLETFNLIMNKHTKVYHKIMEEKFNTYVEAAIENKKRLEKNIQLLLCRPFSEEIYNEFFKKNEKLEENCHVPRRLTRARSDERLYRCYLKESNHEDNITLLNTLAKRCSAQEGHKGDEIILKKEIEKELRSFKLEIDKKTLKKEDKKISRYEMDFEELEVIGKGSFGEVVKVRHKLDGRYYAIKRIKIYQGNSLKRIMGEVQTLSRMHHQYIVRYYQAWFEEAAVKSDTENVLDEDEEEEDAESSDMNYNTSSMKFNFSSTISNTHRTPPSDNAGKTDSKGRKILILYIQTEFCQKTLRSAMNEPQFRDSNLIYQRFRQVMEGMAYIHSQRIIHRDLKPENIFIDSADEIKIGDFGLAKAPANLLVKGEGLNPANKSPNLKENLDNIDNTMRVGTYFYRCPELENTQKVVYDQKVDVYSLGIIFFEMWYPFKSKTERISILSQIRENITLPSKFEQSHPRQAKIVKWMLQKDPEKRPSVYEVLSSDLFPPKMEDDYLKDALRTISNPSTSFFKDLIKAIFRQSKILQVDPDKYIESHSDFTVSHRAFIQETLTSVFKKRSVIPVITSLFIDIPRSFNRDVSGSKGAGKIFGEGLCTNPTCEKHTIKKSQSSGSTLNLHQSFGCNICKLKQASFLNNEGNIMFLRNNLRKGFKKLLVHIDRNLFINSNLKRYEIGDVYVRKGDSIELIRNTHCDFDSIILWEDLEVHNLADTIKTSLEILERFNISSVRVRLNCSILASEFFKTIKINDKKARKYILALFSMVGNNEISVQNARQRLAGEKTLNERIIEKIVTFFNIKGSLSEIKKILEGLFINNKGVERSLLELESLTQKIENLYSITQRVLSTSQYPSTLARDPPEFVLDLSLHSAKFGFRGGYHFSVEIRKEGKIEFDSLCIGGTYDVKYKKLSSSVLSMLADPHSNCETASTTSSFSRRSGDEIPPLKEKSKSTASFGAPNDQQTQNHIIHHNLGKKKALRIAGFTMFMDKVNSHLMRKRFGRSKGDKLGKGINCTYFFKYHVLLCTLGSFDSINMLEIKLNFLMACQLNNVPALIYNYDNSAPSIDEQIDFAERNEINVIVIIKEKTYEKNNKVVVRTKKDKGKQEKEYSLEEFSAFLSRVFKPSLKQQGQGMK